MKKVYIFGNIQQPTKYVIDRIRRRVSLMLDGYFTFYDFKNALRFPRADIFHSKAWDAAVWYHRIMHVRNPRMKHLLTLYGMPYTNMNAARKLVNRADIISCVSLATQREAFVAFGNHYFRVVYDGVDTDFYRPLPIEHEGTVVTMICTNPLRYFKNVAIFNHLSKLFPDVTFYLHAKNDLPISTDYGDSEGVRDIYNRSDIYLFPSIHEGINNTVLEAMACGLPVIAFNVSSMPELIDHGENGFLCNSIKDMEDALGSLIRGEHSMTYFGKNSRNKAEWVTWGRCAQGYKEIYEELTE